MYFSQFPYTYYTLDDKATVQVIRNLLLRIVFNDEIKNNLSIFDEYDIVDGETPEIVASKIYGSSQYHWVVLHMNDIVDPRFEWPLSTYNLIEYCRGKYANIDAIHHYEDSNGYIVNSDAVGAVPVSNFQYEDDVNESKRRIKLLKPQYIQSIVREFTNKIAEVNV